MEKEMTQDEIIFENTQGDHKTGWYREYPYKSSGNILHWLYVYAGLNVAETAIVHSDHVTYHGEVYATFTWNDELQLPVFKFGEKVPAYFQKKQDVYLNGLKNQKAN
jgi:hypothetical protein